MERKEKQCMYVDKNEREYNCLITGRLCVASVDAGGKTDGKGYMDKAAVFCLLYNIGEKSVWQFIPIRVQEAHFKKNKAELETKLIRVAEEVKK